MQVKAPSPVLEVGRVFKHVIPVRWGDLDALNHVNNSIYFRYMEEARARLYEDTGFPVPGPRVPVLAHASCDFLRSVTYPCTVVVRLVLARVGRSSMEYDVVIHDGEDAGVIYVRGKNIVVNTEASSGKSSAWTQAELESYARHFKSPA